MSNLVIVAIPNEDDYVWKISSEKVPHLTVLFLGDDSNVTAEQAQRITDFMEHAVTTANFGPFYLDVDYRGTLGADDADVVFFDKGWDHKLIKDLRAQLLQQSDIRKLHEAAPQFPEWVPHLTLGYPDAPAKLPGKEDNGSGRVSFVRFDRLAIWFDDYEGPEYRLKREYVEGGSNDLAWSDNVSVGEAFISHHGVKGMKWGVRKDDSGSGKTGKSGSKRANKVDLTDPHSKAVIREQRKKRINQTAKITAVTAVVAPVVTTALYSAALVISLKKAG